MESQGIFSERDYKEGEVVEADNLTFSRGLEEYTFVIDGMPALVEGNSLIYRHSNTPNLECIFTPSKVSLNKELKPKVISASLTFKTLCDIKKGEEFTINFNMGSENGKYTINRK